MDFSSFINFFLAFLLQNEFVKLNDEVYVHCKNLHQVIHFLSLPEMFIPHLETPILQCCNYTCNKMNCLATLWTYLAQHNLTVFTDHLVCTILCAKIDVVSTELLPCARS